MVEVFQMDEELSARAIEEEDRILQAVEDVIDFWGFKGIHGRVWGMLYLATEPMTMDEIGERLDLSAGAVSMALKELRQIGVVARVKKRSDRKTHYIAETDFMKMITGILEDREKRIVNTATDRIRESADGLNKLSREAGGASKKELKQKVEKARKLELLGLSIFALIESVAKLRNVDSGALRDLSRLAGTLVETPERKLKRLTKKWKNDWNRLIS